MSCGDRLFPHPIFFASERLCVWQCRIILHGKELEDKCLLSECGLDEEVPTVHLVMRLPAPGTARRKRDPAMVAKECASAGGATKMQGVKVKAEPIEDDDLAAMSFAGIRQLSDMLVDGDQMEFEQVYQPRLPYACTARQHLACHDLT